MVIFSFIYILQEYIEIIWKCLANMNSRGQNLFLHRARAQILKVPKYIFWVSEFFAIQYTLRYLCEERTLEILLQNTMYFVR
jgi:hypothetical protein